MPFKSYSDKAEIQALLKKGFHQGEVDQILAAKERILDQFISDIHLDNQGLTYATRWICKRLPQGEVLIRIKIFVRDQHAIVRLGIFPSPFRNWVKPLFPPKLLGVQEHVFTLE